MIRPEKNPEITNMLFIVPKNDAEATIVFPINVSFFWGKAKVNSVRVPQNIDSAIKGLYWR